MSDYNPSVMVKFVILMGYMGCGKSALGKRLDQSESLSFIDLDGYIESNEKTTISKMFNENGELYFRKKERFYLKKLLSDHPQTIVALGGGTPCYFNNIDYVNQQKDVTTIYLKTTPKVLAQRLFEQKDHRPMIAHINTIQALEEFIAKHLFERIIYYMKAQHHVVTDHISFEDLTQQIKKLLA